MAFYPELKGIALSAYNEMVQKLIAKAEKELGQKYPDELVLRPLRAPDVVVNTSTISWVFTPNTATSWNTIIDDKTIADNRFIGINGVWHGEGITEISELRITKQGRVTRVWDLLPIKQFRNQVGYADDPITIEQNMTLKVECWSRTASTLTHFSLIGAVVESKGILINP